MSNKKTVTVHVYETGREYDITADTTVDKCACCDLGILEGPILLRETVAEVRALQAAAKGEGHGAVDKDIAGKCEPPVGAMAAPHLGGWVVYDAELQAVVEERDKLREELAAVTDEGKRLRVQVDAMAEARDLAMEDNRRLREDFAFAIERAKKVTARRDKWKARAEKAEGELVLVQATNATMTARVRDLTDGAAHFSECLGRFHRDRNEARKDRDALAVDLAKANARIAELSPPKVPERDPRRMWLRVGADGVLSDFHPVMYQRVVAHRDGRVFAEFVAGDMGHQCVAVQDTPGEVDAEYRRAKAAKETP